MRRAHSLLGDLDKACGPCEGADQFPSRVSQLVDACLHTLQHAPTTLCNAPSTNDIAWFGTTAREAHGGNRLAHDLAAAAFENNRLLIKTDYWPPYALHSLPLRVSRSRSVRQGKPFWGPFPHLLTGQQSDAIACIRSVAMHVPVPLWLQQRVHKIIPTAVRPLVTDTSISLCERLRRAKFWETQHPNPAAGGFTAPDGSPVDITCDPRSRQACRKSASVEDCRAAHAAARDKNVVHGFVYTQYGRSSSDWKGSLMPWSWFTLNLVVWRAVWVFLGPVSRRCPPTHIQLMGYYCVRGSYIRRHRDNMSSSDFKRLIGDGEVPRLAGHVPMGGENSQMPGSEVLIYTHGKGEMEFVMRCASYEKLTMPRKKYPFRAKYAVPLGDGTVHVLHSLDDLFWTHEANWGLYGRPYSKQQKRSGLGANDWYRMAFVMRWSQRRGRFSRDGCGLLE